MLAVEDPAYAQAARPAQLLVRLDTQNGGTEPHRSPTRRRYLDIEARASSKLSRHLLDERVPSAVSLVIGQHTPDALGRRGDVNAGRDLDHENRRLRQVILPHSFIAVPKTGAPAGQGRAQLPAKRLP